MTTEVESVRLIAGDTGATPHFTDGQLQTFLDLNLADVRMAAADALDSWAASLAAGAVDVTIGDYRENTTGAARAMGERAAALRKAVEMTPAWAIAEVVPDGPMGVVGQTVLVNAALAGEL